MIKPKTRKEVFMDAIAKGKKPAIEPLTREEVLMYEHAEREASGGGGGGGGGAFIINLTGWASSSVALETDTEYHEYKYGGIIDKTYDEIRAAMDSGMTPVVCEITHNEKNGAVEKAYYPLIDDKVVEGNDYSTTFKFNRTVFREGVIFGHSVSIDKEGVAGGSYSEGVVFTSEL